MKNKIYSKPTVKVFTFLMEDDLVAASSAPVRVGDSNNPFIPMVEEFTEGSTFPTNNYNDI